MTNGFSFYHLFGSRGSIEYRHKSGQLTLKMHGWTSTSRYTGKPKAGGYSIEIINTKLTPVELKWYFKDTSASYPNHLTKPDGHDLHFTNKRDMEKYMVQWANKNQSKINQFIQDNLDFRR